MFYGAGASANAVRIAGDFGVTAAALSSLPAGQVEVLLGTGSSTVPAAPGRLLPARPRRPRPASTAGNNGAAWTAVTVTPNAKFGIPMRLLTNVHILWLLS